MADIKVTNYLTDKQDSKILEYAGSFANTPSAIKTVNTTIDTADLTGVLNVVGSAGNIDCTSIAAGTNGQLMEIWGTSDVNTVTIKSTTTNVKLQGGVDFTLGADDCLVLRYRTTGGVNKWCEISRSNNI